MQENQIFSNPLTIPNAIEIQLTQPTQPTPQDSACYSLSLLPHILILREEGPSLNYNDFAPSRKFCFLQQFDYFKDLFTDRYPLGQLQQQTFSRNDGISNLISKVIDWMAQGESENIAICQAMIVVGSVGFAGIEDLSLLLPQIVDLRVSIHVLSFSGEIYVLKQLCKQSGGNYSVPITNSDIKQALNSLISLKSKNTGPATLLQIALPVRKLDIESLGICASCGEVHEVFFQCPRCLARVCRTGEQCPICGIHIITSVQIAKAARKIMVKQFEVKKKQEQCFTCGDVEEETWQCLDCHNTFCLNCNLYIHEKLLMCPGCM